MSNIVSFDQPGFTPPPRRPEPPIKNGRYEIPDPRTGKPRLWTRATTWAETVEDTFTLNQWKIRMTAVGLARRKDLLASVAAVADPDSKEGKKKLDGFCEAAKEYAGASQRANLGSALHAFLETMDGDGQVEAIPSPWDRDIEAYYAELSRAQIRLSRNYIERICVLPFLGVAGTIDRIAELTDGRRLIFDIKTGTDLSYSWNKIAVQLGIYAHAETIWDVQEKQHHKMPAVDKEEALVAHLPAGEGRCTIHLINIDAGWRTAHLCWLVREWRNRKDLAAPLPVWAEKPSAP